MILGIFYTSERLVNEARKYFPQEYIKEIEKKAYFQESLSGRLKISQTIWKKYLPQEKKSIPYMYDRNCWSLSHKKGVVFFWVSDKALWIDIEIYKQRDNSLFDTFRSEDYQKIWWKNWDSFYILWTAYEAIIKYDRETNYKTDMYVLKNISREDFSISGIEFQYKLTFWKKSKTYTIRSGWKEEKIYSICY